MVTIGLANRLVSQPLRQKWSYVSGRPIGGRSFVSQCVRDMLET